MRPLGSRTERPGLGPAAEAFLATIGTVDTAHPVAVRALAAEFGEHTAMAELKGEADADRAWPEVARRTSIGVAVRLVRPGTSV